MKTVTILSLLLCLSLGVWGQWKQKELSLDEILKESKADLIFVGSVGEYSRGYSHDGRRDSTEANYRITKVLRGDLKSGSANVIFPGHIGFGGGEQIIFATSDLSKVDKNRELRCPGQSCYYTLVEWYLPYSKVNEAKVVRAIKPKQKFK